MKHLAREQRTRIRKMLVSSALCLMCTSWGMAQNRQVTLNLNNVTIKEAIENLKKESGYSVWLNLKDVELNRRVSVNVKDENISKVLDAIFYGQKITYTIDNKLIRIQPQVSRQDKRNIKGKVVDSTTKEPLAGVIIRVNGQQKGTVTNANGDYELTVAPDDYLLVSYLGYEQEKVRVPVGRESLNVYLTNSAVSLNDVVVTGYQTLKKFNMTGAVNTINEQTIDLRGSVGLNGLLEGTVPGLTVYDDRLRIRGGASLEAGNDPLIIVDDFEVEKLPENMDVVESITVLKDAAATAIWGSRAANGVIVIKTKQGKAGNFKISYSGNFKVSAMPDLDDLHRAGSAAIVDYDREVFMKDFLYDAIMDTENGYSLSYEILKDYAPVGMQTVADIPAEKLAEMNSRLDALAKVSNRKQIEDYLLRNAFKQQHNISFSGGNEKVNYYLSGSFIGGHSSYEGDKDKEFYINSRTSYKLNSILTLRADLNATLTDNNNGYTSLSSDIYSLYPFQMLVDGQGNRIYDYSSTFSHYYSDQMVNDYGYYQLGKNLLEEIDLANNHTKETDFKVRLGADFKIMDGLSLSADYQYEKYQTTTRELTDKNSYNGRHDIDWYATVDENQQLVYNVPDEDFLDQSQTTASAWIFKLGANLNRSFGADKEHYVNATAGFEMRSRHSMTDRWRRWGYNDQVLSWQPVDEATLDENGITWWNGDRHYYSSSSYTDFSDVLNKEISYYLSAVYTYDNRYTLSASMRIDESNLFGVDARHRRNPIWAVGLNWNVKNEKFFYADAISALLLRASWGLTGNFDRSGSTTPVMVGRLLYIPAAGDYVTRLTTPPNPQLRWERNREINISLDLGLWERINTTFTYYNNHSSDLLGTAQLDPTVGYTSARVNAANLTNQGFEMQLNADIIRTLDFTWNLGFVFGYNKNKVTNNNLRETTAYLNRVTGTTQFVEGYAREAIWSYRWAGLDNEGNPQVYKADGTKTKYVEELTADDLEYSGTYQPKYSGSVSTGFRWKNLQANFLFTYNYGHVFRVEYPSMNPYSSSPDMSELVDKRWRQPGDEAYTDIPCIPNGQMELFDAQYRDYAARYSSNSIRSGNMVRLREILLNYEMPSSILKHTPLKRLSLTAQFNNIWLWTANHEGYDPEAVDPINGSFSLPNPFSFTAGIKIDF